MKFTINKGALNAKLALLAGTVDRKTTIPVLSSVLMNASGDTLTLTTTNLEVALTVTVAASVAEPGKCAVPLKKVKDYLSLLSDCDINVSVSDSYAFTMSVVGKKIKNRVMGVSPESYPDLPPTPETPVLSIGADTLATALNRSSYCISKDASRFTLNGMLLHTRNGKTKFISTDGTRMAIAEIDATSENGFKLLLPAALTGLVGKVFGAEPLDIYSDDNHIFVKSGPTVLMARKLTGPFPDYERVTPSIPTGLTVNRESLMETCRRASTANANSFTTQALSMDIAPLGIECSIGNGDVLMEETVEVTDNTVPNCRLGINPSFIIEALSKSDGELVRVEIKDGLSSLVLHPVETDGISHLCVISPMRI